MAAIIIWPQISISRRIVGILLDLVALSLLMETAADEAVYLFVFIYGLFWVMALDIGVNYLYVSLIVGFTGFLALPFNYGEYWQAHMYLLQLVCYSSLH